MMIRSRAFPPVPPRAREGEAIPHAAVASHASMTPFAPMGATPPVAAPSLTSVISQTPPQPFSAGEGVGLAEFAAILRRRWWVIAASVVVFMALGMVFLAVTKPIYSASTQVFVDPRNRAAFTIEGTGSGAGYDPNLVDSQIVLIESDTVLRRVIESEKLIEDPEFAKGDGEPRANALLNLKEATKVRRPDRTYIVEIEVRTREAAKSARLANAIARAYLSDGRDSKSETTRREQSWLDTHLAELQRRMRDAENAVEKYKLDNGIVGLAGITTVEQRLGELNKSMVEAQRRTADARATLEQVEMLRRTGRLPDATSDALRSTSIERLRAQLAETLRLEANSRSTLGPRHPAAMEIREQLAEARRQLNEELNRIAEAARNSFNTAKANEAALERQVDSLKRETTSTNQTLVQLRDLERAVEAQKAVYAKFLGDKEQIARLSVDTPAGRVIAPAVPPDNKAFPNKALVLILALAAGLMIGVGLALAIETLMQARRAGKSLAAAPAPLWSPQTALAMPAVYAPPPVHSSPAREPVAQWVIAPPPAAPVAAPTYRSALQQRIIAVTPPEQGGVRLDKAVLEPHSPYAAMINSLVANLRAFPRAERHPLTVLLTAAAIGADTKSLAANLAFALQVQGETAVMIEANPTLPPLHGQVPMQAARFAMPLFGQKQPVTPLPGGTVEGPYLMLQGTNDAWAAIPAAPSRAPSIILIEGPPVGSPALHTMKFERALAGLIIVHEAGAAPAPMRLPPHIETMFATAQQVAA
jgi:polysaccharide biosynthesis transport protein